MCMELYREAVPLDETSTLTDNLMLELASVHPCLFSVQISYVSVMDGHSNKHPIRGMTRLV